MPFPVLRVLSHELGDDGEDGQRVNGQDSTIDRESRLDIDVKRFGLRWLWRGSSSRREVWQRSVGGVKGECPSEVDGDIDMECLIEVGM